MASISLFFYPRLLLHLESTALEAGAHRESQVAHDNAVRSNRQCWEPTTSDRVAGVGVKARVSSWALRALARDPTDDAQLCWGGGRVREPARALPGRPAREGRHARRHPLPPPTRPTAQCSWIAGGSSRSTRTHRSVRPPSLPMTKRYSYSYSTPTLITRIVFSDAFALHGNYHYIVL